MFLHKSKKVPNFALTKHRKKSKTMTFAMNMKPCTILLLLLFASSLSASTPEFEKAFDKRSKTLDISLYISQYGTPTDCSPAVQKALEDCRTEKVRRLYFPRKTYRFRGDKLQKFMTYISNNGDFERCFAFDLTGMENLEIDGGGSLFLFKGFVCPF